MTTKIPTANNIKSWLKPYCASPAIEQAIDKISSGKNAVVDGSRGSSTTLFAGAVAHKLSRMALLVVAHLDDVDDAIEDLKLIQSISPNLSTHRFGALEVLPGESNISIELLAERMAVVDTLTDPKKQKNNKPVIIVASIQSLMQAVPDAKAVNEWAISLQPGREYNQSQLINWLAEKSYSRVDVIEQPGEFAVRGGIVDIYLPPIDQNENAIRIDYFGDEIESINQIDPDTMGSGIALDRINIVGASAQQLQSDSRTCNILSLLPKDTIVILDELMELSEQGRGYYERLTNPRGIYAPNTVFFEINKFPTIQINQYSNTKRDPNHIFHPVAILPDFAQNAADAMRDLKNAAEPENCKQTIVICQKQAELERLNTLIEEHIPDTASKIKTQVGYLHRGFSFTHNLSDESHTLLVPHHELFHRYHLRRRIKRIGVGAAAQSSTSKNTDAFIDVNVGDVVVHEDHGIAIFKGLKSLKRDGLYQEYLTLEFDDKVLIHVPATQIQQVQKYIGGFSGKPTLSKVGGKRWQKQKDAVKEAVKDLAKEMLQIQAARASAPGIRYPQDTPWMKEFEAEFPYTETQDQLAAIHEIKNDMQDPQPMDRLICGDVGFGKTELAIRAAFKAIEHGKQVAILVPTTVLAEQHENTFRQRMADYPFKVDSISRFKTPKEQKLTLRALREGNIDIIIGTHRILSKDIGFKDLGLVIIDEEQRFGVEHKQALLTYRMTVDVLTLTATPIPRTLHMSMLGLRDISSLATAPLDRRAIVTEVIPFDRKRIKQALIRELNREGQIYFVHNKIHDIKAFAAQIQELVPNAKIGIGHGQMGGHELEKVMLKFMRKEIDILVSTTIIESGIDNPNANTMFIHEADRFGLAALHQLRGRVGRWKHRAYCYLLLPEERQLTEISAKRLKAIEQYSMLGAGFKIAMRDLEIRGAGNLLGGRTIRTHRSCRLRNVLPTPRTRSKKTKQQNKSQNRKHTPSAPTHRPVPKTIHHLRQIPHGSIPPTIPRTIIRTTRPSHQRHHRRLRQTTTTSTRSHRPHRNQNRSLHTQSNHAKTRRKRPHLQNPKTSHHPKPTHPSARQTLRHRPKPSLLSPTLKLPLTTRNPTRHPQENTS